MKKKLQRNFFKRDPLIVAQDILGKILVHESEEGEISGRIIEVEAYQANIDKAAHSYTGKSERNKSLYLEGGHIYLHKIHNHICMDIVTGFREDPNSVLLRSLKPIEGIDIMKKNRGKEELTDLTTGPGKLVEALSIPFQYDGYDMCRSDSKVYVVDDGYRVEKESVVRTERVGISKSKELKNRFILGL
jgi:DNA-3-methyladenine glycosylase